MPLGRTMARATPVANRLLDLSEAADQLRRDGTLSRRKVAVAGTQRQPVGFANDRMSDDLDRNIQIVDHAADNE